MKKFIITEEEKNHIKALYEQTSTVQQWEEKYKKGVTEEGNFYLVTGRGQSPNTATARKIAFQDAKTKISAKTNSNVSIPDGSEGESKTFSDNQGGYFTYIDFKVDKSNIKPSNVASQTPPPQKSMKDVMNEL